MAMQFRDKLKQAKEIAPSIATVSTISRDDVATGLKNVMNLVGGPSATGRA